MAESARIESVESIRRFRPALIAFGEEAQAALMTASASAAKTLEWLGSRQLPHWQKEIRRREELLARAKSELIRKQAEDPREPRSTVDERKAVERCKHAIAEAKDKAERTRRWIRQLEKEMAEYSGRVQALQTMLRSELPRAVAVLDRMSEALEEYLAVAPPPGADAAPAAGAPSAGTGSVAAADPAPGEEHPALRRLVPAAEERAAAAPADADEPAGAGGTVTVARAWLEAPRVFLVRLDPATDGDTGWYLGPADPASRPPSAADLERLPTAELLRLRPSWRPVLGLPKGTLAVAAPEAVEYTVDEQGSPLDPGAARGEAG